jgi:hypothetical protein
VTELIVTDLPGKCGIATQLGDSDRRIGRRPSRILRESIEGHAALVHLPCVEEINQRFAEADYPFHRSFTVVGPRAQHCHSPRRGAAPSTVVGCGQ